MSTTELPDKRQFQRFAMDVPVEVEVLACAANPELRGRRLQCQTRDVSLCGLQLQSAEALPPGTHVGLRVELRDGDRAVRLKLAGDVIWSNVFPEVGPVAGVYLRDRPRRHMRRWMDVIGAELKRQLGAPSAD